MCPVGKKQWAGEYSDPEQVNSLPDGEHSLQAVQAKKQLETSASGTWVPRRPVERERRSAAPTLPSTPRSGSPVSGASARARCRGRDTDSDGSGLVAGTVASWGRLMGPMLKEEGRFRPSHRP